MIVCYLSIHLLDPLIISANDHHCPCISSPKAPTKTTHLNLHQDIQASHTPPPNYPQDHINKRPKPQPSQSQHLEHSKRPVSSVVLISADNSKEEREEHRDTFLAVTLVCKRAFVESTPASGREMRGFLF
jgi:hypothetical protein